MFEIIKKHFTVKNESKKSPKQTRRMDDFAENVSNGYVMAMLSGIYSVNVL